VCVGPFRFLAGGYKRRPNLAVVFNVYLVLLYALLWMSVVFRRVRLSFSVFSREIGWEERPILC